MVDKTQHENQGVLDHGALVAGTNAPQRIKRLPVMEVFGPTIQGEGLVAGTQTYFIRFGLCDYRCTKCDSLHAVDPASVKANASWLVTSEIINRLKNLDGFAPWVTLSGGNPAIHDLTELVLELNRLGYKVAVETQGTLAPSWLHMVDVLTVSPKPPGMGETFEPDKFGAFMDRFYRHPGFNIKIPVFSAMDLEFAASIAELCGGWFAELPNVFYLSLGNPWPPTLDPEFVQEPVYAHNSAALMDDEHLALRLLKEYKSLYDDIRNDVRLRMYRFLPQLHVLVWGNAKGK